MATSEALKALLLKNYVRVARSNSSMSLKGAKSSWWCYTSRGLVILRIDALRNQAQRRRRDHKIWSSRGLASLGVVTQPN